MIAETYQIGTAKLAYDRLLASVFERWIFMTEH